MTADSGWRRLLRNPMAMAGLTVLGLILLLALFGPFLAAHEIDEVFWDRIGAPPDFAAGFYFGTDANGRDLFARTLAGARVSLLVGTAASLISLVIGVTYGAIAGYLGGRIDAVMMRIVDILYSLPFVFFVILLTVYVGRSLSTIFITIGAVIWLDMARIVRGQTLSLKQREFIEAARAFGATDRRIILRHIIPNLWGPVIISMLLVIPDAILTESFLSFLGLGVQEPNTSWGVLIGDGAQNMMETPWMLLFPGAFLALTLLAFNFLGDGLRDAMDPKE
ncbi:ABC transporter permease [Telmatospirillum siberiense]|uniref:Oligopeptide transport system permease protein OppC n=1 Tax=Telmatospirillum siberiense TaxID=382514 RepID=A0A2N3PPZ5_9PROT|nr:ABC transporter permease subunit [Telmatospirillum siberiense]PKU22464.1 peptide ABC transporter permease [Telmatospirillum siberiense]